MTRRGYYRIPLIPLTGPRMRCRERAYVWELLLNSPTLLQGEQTKVDKNEYVSQRLGGKAAAVGTALRSASRNMRVCRQLTKA